MNSLLQLVTLNHRIFEFLAGLSADRLAGLADGRLRLTLVEEDPADPVVRPQPTGIPAGTGDGPHADAPPPDRLDAPPAPADRRRRDRAGLTPPRASAATRHGDLTGIADTLRAMESLEEGARYLRDLKLLKSDILALGTELGVSIPQSTVKDRALTLVLNQAIGARRKFAGLGKW